MGVIYCSSCQRETAGTILENDTEKEERGIIPFPGNDSKKDSQFEMSFEPEETSDSIKGLNKRV